MVDTFPLEANSNSPRPGDIMACVWVDLREVTVAILLIIVVIPGMGVRITFHPVILDNSSIMAGIVVLQVLQVVLSNLKAWGHPVLRVKDLNITHRGRPTLIPNNSRWPKEDIPPIVIMDRLITMGLRRQACSHRVQEGLSLRALIRTPVHRPMDIRQTVSFSSSLSFAGIQLFCVPRSIKSDASSLDAKRPNAAHQLFRWPNFKWQCLFSSGTRGSRWL